MAIAVDEVTKVISIPKADLLFVSGVIYALDTDALRLELRVWEASAPGSWRSVTHKHNQPVTVGGVTLARVIEIINSYTITFEDGQYRVLLQGSNNNILDVANVNQVSVAPNNSAGLTYSKQVEDQSFTDSRVWIDVAGGLSGTQFPRGTPGDPVNNLADAQAIVAARTLPKRLHLRGTLVVGAAESLDDYDVIGASATLSSVNVDAAATTANLTIESVTLLGDMSGSITARKSTSVVNLTDFNGHIIDSGIDGVIRLANNADVVIENCHSELAGTSKPIIIMGTNCTLQLRNYSGGVDIQGCTAGCVVSVDLDPGDLTLDSTNTGGDLLVRGIGTLDDQSAGTTVTDRLISTQMDLALKLLEADQVFDKGAGLLHYYERGTTTDLIPAKAVVGEAQTVDASITE